MYALTDFAEMCELQTYPPDGKYVATIGYVETFRRAVSKPHVKFHVRITEGKYAGLIIQKILWLHTEDSHAQFVKEMQQIGFDIDSLDELVQNERALIGLSIVIQIRRQQNKVPQVYFLRRA